LWAEADLTRLAQVFSNLLNNAAKFTEPGGTIHVSARANDAAAVVSVTDNGVGIPAGLLPSIFDMFTQLQRFRDRTQGGLGIGLTLVKSLVELHGGTVKARSDGVGKGSEFVVRLPLVPTVPDTRSPDKMESRPAVLPSRRVLVVDDNRDAAESLGMLLKLLGADVQVAYNGVDALRLFAEYQPAVVLLDIGMPGMDGYEVARRLREMPGSAGVSLIALTGWGQAEDRYRSESAGFDHHLVKPADIQTLQNVLVASKGFTEDSATRH
jgi:CheY-like chemotaxis protein/anti-sigma regulatory factor (Ser/Thr protein kinase)